MAKYTPVPFEIKLRPEGFVFDVGSLFEALLALHDQRDARGIRYALVTVLVFVLLAKLAGEDGLRGIAQWVAERQEVLAEGLGLANPQAPCYTTYGRILGHAVAVAEFEQVVTAWVAGLPGAGHTVEMALDGKTLRGTIPFGQTRGVHLLAAYFPAEGLVFAQVAVESRENEIGVAPQVLKMLDLRGKIITGDALLTQRKLSLQIVEAGGDYVFPVKENQPQLLHDIQTLFAPEHCVKGFSPGPQDFRSAQQTEKGHGRIEQRRLTVSGELQGYLNWPSVAQVFKLERAFTQVNAGKVTHETVYGVTSLTAQKAGATRLLQITRGHWGIESGLHYRRDVTLREDRSRVRIGHAPQAFAIINNLVLGLFARLGYTSAPEARRHFAAHLDEAVCL
ncbi:MAG TPA: ISAs1 family transposase, partial [Anaerolineales bacterium]